MYEKNQNKLLYVLFGIFTTIVNVFVYWLMAHSIVLGFMPSAIISWIVAVMFAYFTNRKWVFRSKAKTIHENFREVISFISFRLATGVVDWCCMFIFVDVLKINDFLIKFLANIIVIILNI